MSDTKTLAINVFVVIIPIIVIAYSASIVSSGIQNNNNNNNSNNYNGNNKVQCNNSNSNNNDIHVKMFDSQIVPKYIIGKDYKITPISPATTDVLVNGCTLAARAISQ